MTTSSPYRTHKCGDLRKSDAGSDVTLSGWIHRKRDHGGVLFIDLRDTYGLTQCVVDLDSPLLAEIERWRPESVITVTGKVKPRHTGTENARMPTGDIEVYIEKATLQSAAEILPLQVADEDQAGEDIRLKYRFLDLRREGMHSRIRLRNNVIQKMRQEMWAARVSGIQHPDPHRLQSGGRARLPRPLPPAPRQVLRSAPGAAAIQAAIDGRRLRPLLPDRAVFPG